MAQVLSLAVTDKYWAYRDVTTDFDDSTRMHVFWLKFDQVTILLLRLIRRDSIKSSLSLFFIYLPSNNIAWKKYNISFFIAGYLSQESFDGQIRCRGEVRWQGI